MVNVTTGTTPISQPPDAQSSKVHYEGGGKITINGETMPVMVAVALVFVKQADAANKLTADNIADTQKTLDDLQKTREILDQLKQAQGDGKPLPSDVKDFCEKHNIALPGDAKTETVYRDKDGNVLTKDDDTDGDPPGTVSQTEDLKLSNQQFSLLSRLWKRIANGLTDTNQIKSLKLKMSVNHGDEAVAAASDMVKKVNDGVMSVLNKL